MSEDAHEVSTIKSPPKDAEKIRVYIHEDEHYPVYELEHKQGMGAPYDIDEKTVKRWRRVLAEYTQVQEEMKSVYSRPFARD
jgi:hypothetical protein